MFRMSPYGLKGRLQVPANCADAIDVQIFGLKTAIGGNPKMRNRRLKGRTRRYFKRVARAAGKAEIRDQFAEHIGANVCTGKHRLFSDMPWLDYADNALV